MTDYLTPPFATEIVIAVRDDLQTWQRLNVTAFLAAVITSKMFSTAHDGADRAVVGSVPSPELDLVGLAAHGPKNAVDKALKGMRLHP